MKLPIEFEKQNENANRHQTPHYSLYMLLQLVGLSDNKKSISNIVGNLLIKTLPWVIKSLSVIGTIALLMVAGGIFVHNIDFLHHFLEILPSFIKDFVVGLIVGSLAFFLVKAFIFIKTKLLKKKQ